MLNEFDSLKKLILSYDSVSFDVFDTLLIRKHVIDPPDLFYMLAIYKGLKHKEAIQFRSDRVKSEKIMRDLRMIKESCEEVSLHEIYKPLNIKYKISPEDEIDFEISILKPRLIIKDLYHYAKNLGKKIYAISDTYFSAETLNRILSSNGYQFDGVYSSCELSIGKYERKLFEFFIEDNKINRNQNLHIGDNKNSDYLSAMQSGIPAALINKQADCLFLDSRFNLTAIHKMHAAQAKGQLFYGCLISHLASERELRNNISGAQIFAIMYASPLLYYFSKWLLNTSRTHKIRKLYLMARDGYTLEKVLNKFNHDISIEVFTVSRRTVLFPAACKDFEIWSTFFSSASHKPLIDIISDLRLESHDEILKIIPENIIYFSELTISQQANFIKDSYKIALPQMRNEFNDYLIYLHKIGLGSDNTAVVDVGWSLSSHKALEIIMGRKLRGFYVGNLSSGHSHDLISSFLFNGFANNPEWESIFHSAVELLELAFISNEKQVIRIVGDKFEFNESSSINTIRGIVSNEIRVEVLNFLDKLPSFFLTTEINPSPVNFLQEIYHSLTFHPTPFEFAYLGSIPHDRFIAGSGIETISNYWQLHSKQAPIAKTTLLDKIRVVFLSLTTHGFIITFKKIIQRLLNQ